MEKIRTNIRQIQRIGAPVQSRKTILAQGIQDPTPDWGYVKGGDIAAGLAAGLKGYLGMRGALEDARNQYAYNENQAQLAEQERQDKLAQQGWDQDYKERYLAQDLEKAKMALEAAKAKEDATRNQQVSDIQAQWAHDQAMYDQKRADALADRDAQIQAAIQTELRKQAYEQRVAEQKAEEARKAEELKDLDAVMQKRLTAEDYAKWRQNPDAYEISGDNWFKRKFGGRANLSPKSQPIQINGFTIVEE